MSQSQHESEVEHFDCRTYALQTAADTAYN